MAIVHDRPGGGDPGAGDPGAGDPGAAHPAAGHSAPPRPRQNFETWSWLFMRVSGLALLFLALSHFAITHLFNDVVDTNYRFVAHRWRNPLWRVFDWSLLALALLHGLNGLRVIVDDYVRSAGRRLATKAVLYSVTAVLFAFGTFTIATFPRG